MPQRIRHLWLSRFYTTGLWAVALLAVNSGHAQTNSETSRIPTVGTLPQAYAAAWVRQPEALSFSARRESAESRRNVADSWTAEPPTLEFSSKTDQLNKNLGRREYVAGIALPLWLPGERALTGALADAELQLSSSRVLAAQLRTASTVRDAWWNVQRARSEHALVAQRLNNARQLAADVLKRVGVGDLARSDQHQAAGAVASAELALAEAESALSSVSHKLRSLIGAELDLGKSDMSDAEPLPDVPDSPNAPNMSKDFSTLDRLHPSVLELLDRAELARRGAELARVQIRANPELTLATSGERGLFGDPYQQSVTFGVRIPLGSTDRNRTKASQAQAEAIEAEGQLRLERELLIAALDSARNQLESLRIQLAAAEKRAQLANETRGFFDKSFRLGETDLPTRLRIELEAVEAERQVARRRIELAASISALRQAMGLLPIAQ